MASRLLKRVCLGRFGGSKAWLIRPDHGSIVNWRIAVSETQELLERGNPRVDTAELGVLVEERPSSDYALVQVADIFAGVATFSANETVNLLASRSSVDHESLSWSQRYRLPLVGRVLQISGGLGHRTMVRPLGGLTTNSQEAPINFWPFSTPRGEGNAPMRLVSR